MKKGKKNAHKEDENKLKKSDLFYKIYENEYLNTYFLDNDFPKASLVEIDKKILVKVILQYNELQSNV